MRRAKGPWVETKRQRIKSLWVEFDKWYKSGMKVCKTCGKTDYKFDDWGLQQDKISKLIAKHFQ